MKNHDWTKFTKRINIKADHATIFSAWSSQEQLEKWFLSKAEFTSSNNILKNKSSEIENGDKYIWMWHGSDNVTEGEILEKNNTDYIFFTFLGCEVSINIKIENGVHVITLIQSKIPLDDASRVRCYLGCSRGWTFYLANLKSILEGGIDLRNRNKELINVINT